MKYIDISKFLHNFGKVNLTTIMKRGRLYDIYRCSECGIEGKRYGLSGQLELLTSVSDKKIKECTGLSKQMKDEFVGKWVKITECTAVNPQFKALLPGSIHKIVTPPEGFINGDRGVWVMGVGQPVKVLFNEFNDFKFKRTRFKRAK